jgi:hypothetical protein
MMGLIGLFRKEFPCPFYERLPFNILRLLAEHKHICSLFKIMPFIITKGKRLLGFLDKI